MYQVICTKGKVVVVLQRNTLKFAEIAANVYRKLGYTVEVKRK